MSYDWLLRPISEDTPCGPDLAEEGDEAFLDYYYEAEGRLPERYFTPGLRVQSGEGTDDKLFDPKSVDIKAETTKIEALLKRSRDVRLLTLLARFQVLAGRLPEFAETVKATADLLEAFPEAAHPRVGQNASDRRNALDELANVVTVGMPLQYMPLTADRDITYRRYLVASGQAEARSGEEDIETSALISALADRGAHEVVNRNHASLSTAATSLQRIVAACKTHSERSFSVDADRTLRTITDLQSFIRLGRSDLPLWSDEAPKSAPEKTGAPEAAETPQPPGGAQNQGAAETPAVQDPGPSSGSPVIETHTAARAALMASERYFGTHEPASAALLLVTQARLLIGRPLIEALETLLPEHASRAVIDFGPETGFVLPIDRLKALSTEVAGGPAATPAEAETPEFSVASRQEVARHILAVEEFFRRKEPASPVPVLLQRARSYLEKDFHALVTELIPVPRE